MDLRIKNDLPFLGVTITYQGFSLTIQDILVDTGSTSTVFAADVVADLGIVPEAEDVLRTIQGVGGVEVVYERQINELKIENHSIRDLVIEVGGMDYGFAINGILGMDVLKQISAIINLAEMKIEFAESLT